VATKQEYKEIIQNKLSQEKRENQGKTDGVTSTDQSKGSNTHVSTKDKLH